MESFVSYGMIDFGEFSCKIEYKLYKYKKNIKILDKSLTKYYICTYMCRHTHPFWIQYYKIIFF